MGAFLATLGVVLPSFLLILLIAAVVRNLMKYAGVTAFLSGVRPCVVALILATAVTMVLSTLFGVTTISGGVNPDYRAVFLFVLLFLLEGVLRRKKKALAPVSLILVSAGLGILFYGIG